MCPDTNSPEDSGKCLTGTGNKENNSPDFTDQTGDAGAPDPHVCPLNHNCRAKCRAWKGSGRCLAGAGDQKEIKRNISNLPAALRWFKRNHKWHEPGRMTNLGKLRLVFRKPVRSAVNKMLADRLDGLTAKIETVFSKLQNNAEALDGLRVNDEDELVMLEHTMAYLDEGLGELANLVESGRKGSGRCLAGARDQKEISELNPQERGTVAGLKEKTADELWITVSEAAHMLSKHPGTISHWVRDGKIRDNGKKRLHRRIAKADILLIKQAAEEKDAKKDADEERRDKRRMDRLRRHGLDAD